MAVYVATDHKITINGTNLSASLQSVSIDVSADEVETTAFGSGYRTRLPGLKSGSVTLNFFQDFAASSIDSTLWTLFNASGTATYATVVVLPTSSAVGSANPAYTAVCVVTQYQPYSASVGDIATLSVTWPTTGTVTRAVA